MVVSIVYFEACPNWREALRTVRRALDATGQVAQVSLSCVDQLSDDFPGSPTVLVDGRDVVPVPGTGGQACRLYPTGSGLRSAPSLEQVMTAIRQTARQTVKEG